MATRPQVLGTINTQDFLDRDDNEKHPVTWEREDGTVISIVEPPPPWETADQRFAASDARRFVECPPQWRLHWVNPRLLDSEGWRDWQAVQASDDRVVVKVDSMVTPEGYVRRGGPGGDILCWMWTGWYESRKKAYMERTAAQTQSAVNKQQELREDFARGQYGPYIQMTDAKHPTHTMAEGKSLRD